MPLNQKQQEAVEYLDGPLLVLAGPGTGKTQLLSKKVEYILQNTDTDPSMILCITYTEAGAENMKELFMPLVKKFSVFIISLLQNHNVASLSPSRRLFN